MVTTAGLATFSFVKQLIYYYFLQKLLHPVLVTVSKQHVDKNYFSIPTG